MLIIRRRLMRLVSFRAVALIAQGTCESPDGEDGRTFLALSCTTVLASL
jgi:hypothetical protein